MKKHLLFISTLIISFISIGQCTDDFDWGEAEYGVSPDPEVGETFDDAELDVPYEDTIHILVPQSASDIDATYPALPIDSAVLNSIIITQGENSYTPAEFGLELTCNNGGSSVNPCTFLGGQSGCGLLSGTPLIPGEFNVSIEATVYVTIVVPFPYDFNYEGYTLTVAGEVSVNDIVEPLSEVRITPNPFSSKALIQFNALKGGQASFKVFNLLGEEKINENINLDSGLNKIQISADKLESGVYLYFLEIDEFKITKRLVINK